MPSIQINATTIALTDATATALTCTSTAGLVVGMRGWAVKSDDTGNLEVKISAIFDETTFLCQRLSAANNSGGADLTAYNGGNIYFDTQVVEVSFDTQVVEVSGGADLSSFDAITTGRVPAKTTTGFINATLANVPDSATRAAVTPAARVAAEALAAGTASTGTLTTIAVAGYADGDHFTIPDGTNSVKFEPRAKAVSTVALIDLADIGDNYTLVVGDGANDPVTFEAQMTGEPTFSTGSITCVAPANLKNNESCSIGPDNTFAFNVEAAAQAAGSLTFQAKADCTDGDTFTLYSQVFEIDKTGDGVTGTNIAIDISDAGVVTASDVAGVAKTAITTEFGAETVTAGTITDGVLALESVDSSYAANAAITVTGTSCTATGMTGGATEFSAGEATEVDITAAADVDDVADALGAAINLASIDVTAGVPVSGVIPLTSDIPGPIEIEIIDAVADAGFTHENIAGGLIFIPTLDTTLIDFSECETEEEKVAAVVDAINAATTAEDLDLVAEDGGDGATFTATNTATGTMTMTFTGDLVGSATPVSAGLGGAVPVSGAVPVDMTGLTTATQGAAKICQVANALGAEVLDVTCVPNAGNIAVTNNTNGSAGNAAITENVANAGFTVSGMTGGRNPLASTTLDDVPDSDTRVAVPPAARTAAEALATLWATGQTDLGTPAAQSAAVTALATQWAAGQTDLVTPAQSAAVAALATQGAAGQTDLVTPAARTAAEALATQWDAGQTDLVTPAQSAAVAALATQWDAGQTDLVTPAQSAAVAALAVQQADGQTDLVTPAAAAAAEALAAQQADGQTDLVTPAARAAAEALADGTVGALVKIGSDGLPADASVTDAQLSTIYAAAEALAAQQAAGQTDLVTPTTRAAAEALATQWAAGQTDLVTPAAAAAAEALAPEVTDILAVANLRLKDAALTDADATVSPGVSKVALYELPAATLSANRAVRVAISDMVAGQAAAFVRRDRSAYTLTIIDDVTGSAVFVFGASPTGDDVATVQFDGIQVRYGVTARLS